MSTDHRQLRRDYFSQQILAQLDQLVPYSAHQGLHPGLRRNSDGSGHSIRRLQMRPTCTDAGARRQGICKLLCVKASTRYQRCSQQQHSHQPSFRVPPTVHGSSLRG
jgi:hypothetical protein